MSQPPSKSRPAPERVSLSAGALWDVAAAAAPLLGAQVVCSLTRPPACAVCGGSIGVLGHEPGCQWGAPAAAARALVPDLSADQVHGLQPLPPRPGAAKLPDPRQAVLPGAAEGQRCAACGLPVGDAPVVEAVTAGKGAVRHFTCPVGPAASGGGPHGLPDPRQAP